MSSGRYTPKKVWAMTDMPASDAAVRLAECDCPATIIVSGADVIIEHVHHPKCPVLLRWKRTNR